MIRDTALPKDLQHFTKDRDTRWLWRYLVARGLRLPDENSVSPAQASNVMATAIEGTQPPGQLVREILEAHRNLMLPEDSYRWIEKDDDRQIIWLYLELQKYATNPANIMFIRPLGMLPSERRRDEIVVTMDACGLALPVKQQMLADMKMWWGQQRTPDRDTKWLDAKNASQLTWAWDYLTKDFKTFSIPKPVTTREHHHAILAALDQLTIILHPAEKRVFLDKMKKTWGQKKFRDSGKAKKPYNLPLTKGAKSQLELLAKQQGISENKVLEQLIQASFTAANGTSSV